MKRLSVIAVLLLVAACSSAPSAPKANIPAPDVSIEQTVGPAELGYPAAPFEVKYDFHLVNHASVPITLRRIAVHTVNPPGGAYTLTPRSYTFNIPIAPGEEKVVTQWLHATGYGVSMRDNEPVTVKGVAYFDTPNGVYNHIFNEELQQ